MFERLNIRIVVLRKRDKYHLRSNPFILFTKIRIYTNNLNLVILPINSFMTNSKDPLFLTLNQDTIFHHHIGLTISPNIQ